MQTRFRFMVACFLVMAFAALVWVNAAQVSSMARETPATRTAPVPFDSPIPVDESFLPAVHKLMTSTPTIYITSAFPAP